MNRIASSVLAASLVLITRVPAGESLGEKTVLDRGKTPIEECADLGGTLGISYLSDQFIHGMRLNRDTVVSTVGYRFEALLPLRFEASHGMGISTIFPYTVIGPVDLTDVGITAELGSVFGFEVGLGYKHRFINFTGAPGDVDADYGEVGVSLRRDLGFVDFVASSTLGIDSRDSFFAAGGGSGWVHTAGLEKSFRLCSSASLILSGGVGYHDGFFYDVAGTSDWSHYYVGAALPIQLNCRTTLTPYIGYQGVQQWDVFFPQGDVLHGGVNLQVSF